MHSRPSRGSTEMAVRTAPPISPSSCSTRSCRADRRGERRLGLRALGRGFGRCGGRLGEHLGARRQRSARHRGVDRHDVRELRRRHIGQRAQRQSVADRRIARHQEQLAAPRLPFFRAPARVGGGCIPALHRQDIAARLGQAALEHMRHARAFLGVLQLRIGGIDIVGQLAFTQQPFGRVLIGLGDHLG